MVRTVVFSPRSFYKIVLCSCQSLQSLTYTYLLVDMYFPPTFCPLLPRHQGWNDGCDKNMTIEYETNLANLIRDIRVDLDIPKLPVAIGTTGMLGFESTDQRFINICNAQLAMNNATKYPEFVDNVIVKETRGFHRDPSISPAGFQYHWNGNCESYWLVGKAMAEGMIQLLGMGKDDERQEKKRDKVQGITAQKSIFLRQTEY